jgi:hypothetical protein
MSARSASWPFTRQASVQYLGTLNLKLEAWAGLEPAHRVLRALVPYPWGMQEGQDDRFTFCDLNA